MSAVLFGCLSVMPTAISLDSLGWVRILEIMGANTEARVDAMGFLEY